MPPTTKKHEPQRLENTAVAPVIAVVLLVGLTVALGTMIGIMAAGFSAVGSTPNAAFNINDNGEKVQVTIVAINRLDGLHIQGFNQASHPSGSNEVVLATTRSNLNPEVELASNPGNPPVNTPGNQNDTQDQPDKDEPSNQPKVCDSPGNTGQVSVRGIGLICGDDRVSLSSDSISIGSMVTIDYSNDASFKGKTIQIVGEYQGNEAVLRTITVGG